MPNPLSDLFFGSSSSPRAADVVEPRRTFADVILPEETRRALDRALTQIRKRDLIGEQWGLAERHPTGLGLAFNFAGPPGTGKTLCAEALADALGRSLMLVRYDEMQSMWMGATGKNIAGVFDAARKQGAVLFFDEADAIAGRRSSHVNQGYQREANAIVNVLLRELEAHEGVVIFATNLAATLDPAFERRIRTHVLFRMPDAAAREKIWQVQLHRRKTPLADDVDFGALAAEFEVSGGDIKNAVLNAAQAAAAEPGPDEKKQIHQRHFFEGMQAVLAGKQVMKQSLFDPNGSDAAAGVSVGGGPQAMLAQHLDAFSEEQEQLVRQQETLTDRLEALGEQQHRQADQLVVLERALELLTEQIEQTGQTQETLSKQIDQAGEAQSAFSERLDRNEQAQRQAQENLSERLDGLAENREAQGARRRRTRRWLWIGLALALVLSAAALIVAL